MIGRADIEGSKSNVAMNAWLPQASYPCLGFGGWTPAKPIISLVGPGGPHRPPLDLWTPVPGRDGGCGSAGRCTPRRPRTSRVRPTPRGGRLSADGSGTTGHHGNFSGTSSLKFRGTKGSIGHTFMVCIHTENQNQGDFYPFVLLEISVLHESPLGHLRYGLTDVPPQPNSPPDNVINPDRPARDLNARSWAVKPSSASLIK